MCGIVGIYAYRAVAPEIDRAELRNIRDYMAARGPNGAGEWHSPDRRISFGHRRLSIIDLSPQAAQPMVSKDKTLVITFNGEIYNSRALRAELEAKGRVFRTKSDTEVVLQLYAEKGESMVLDLRGMFAFGIWDSQRRILFLARDPYGIKPLYYSDDGKCVRFASQVKALAAGKAISTSLDPAGIVGFCLFGSVPEPFTIQKQVKALPAGSILRISEESRRNLKPYFSMGRVLADATDTEKATTSDNQKIVKEALRESVRSHARADVPLGLFLSAGVDSGALAGLTAEALRPKALRTLNLAFEEFRGHSDDEAPLAAQVARLFGADHSVRVVRQSEFEADLPRIFAAMDQPTIDGVNTWFASKAARERGLKVMLSGLGGDELFGGYPSFRDLPRWVSALRLPGRLPGLGVAFRHACRAMAQLGSPSHPKLASLFEYGGSYSGAYLLRRGLFMPWELPGLLGQDLTRDGLAKLNPLADIARVLSPDPGGPFGRVATLEASFYMKNQLLRDTDWASMAHSLEVRTPFVDSTLLKTLAALLVDPHRPPGKTWLALAPFPELPQAVIRRPKTGFLTPMDEWIGASKALPEINAYPNPPKPTHWSRRWAVTVLSQFVPKDDYKAAA